MVEMSKENDIATDTKASSSGLRDSLVTYKRRKTAKIVEDPRIWSDSVTQLNEKPAMHLFDEASQRRSDDPTTASIDFSLKHSKNIVLKQISQSLESECVLTKCIKSTIVFHPGSNGRTTVKKSVYSYESGGKFTFQSGSAKDGPQNAAGASEGMLLHDGPQNAATTSVGMTSNGSVNGLNHGTVTELCLATFSDIIMSEKFAQLCSLLLEHFPGVKADRVFDMSLVSSRMKEKLYENSPVLFHSDIQQIWTKLQKVGTDMIALVKCLSDKTSTSFHEQVGSSVHSISKDNRHEILMQECNMHTKGEPTEDCALNEVLTCRHCGEKADGRNVLVCDSCEEMYHISCIEPAVKEIPSKSWYCANCTAKGIESPHINCVVCERLNTSDDLVYKESPEELEEISNELVTDEENKRFPECKVCRTEVTNDGDYRICGHSFCPHKFYHVRCLSNKQLVAYGPCWYCPSCLCRGCFTDQDDDKIVLCDGCDHAYHIYCMQPPHTAIPKGKWFCEICDSGIQRIRKAKRSHENMQSNTIRKVPSGGVDMLLNAAQTLNYEEDLAAMGLEAK